jgi:hypothetical protein
MKSLVAAALVLAGACSPGNRTMPAASPPPPLATPTMGPTGVTWILDPVHDEPPDGAHFVMEDTRIAAKIDLGIEGYSGGAVSAIDVAYVQPVEDDDDQEHHVIWHVFADEENFPADTPLATIDTRVVPPNIMSKHEPMRWTHHEFRPAPSVGSTFWLTWQTPSKNHSVDIAFRDSSGDDSIHCYSALPCYVPGGGVDYCRPRMSDVDGTPFVRVTLTDVVAAPR